MRLKSQLAVKEIIGGAGRLVRNEEYKDVWIRRDTNLEERQKEKELRQEAKEKT